MIIIMIIMIIMIIIIIIIIIMKKMKKNKTFILTAHSTYLIVLTVISASGIFCIWNYTSDSRWDLYTAGVRTSRSNPCPTPTTPTRRLRNPMPSDRLKI